jgi:hypothetical protein
MTYRPVFVIFSALRRNGLCHLQDPEARGSVEEIVREVLPCDREHGPSSAVLFYLLYGRTGTNRCVRKPNRSLGHSASEHASEPVGN